MFKTWAEAQEWEHFLTRCEQTMVGFVASPHTVSPKRITTCASATQGSGWRTSPRCKGIVFYLGEFATMFPSLALCNLCAEANVCTECYQRIVPPKGVLHHERVCMSCAQARKCISCETGLYVHRLLTSKKIFDIRPQCNLCRCRYSYCHKCHAYGEKHKSPWFSRYAGGKHVKCMISGSLEFRVEAALIQWWMYLPAERMRMRRFGVRNERYWLACATEPHNGEPEGSLALLDALPAELKHDTTYALCWRIAALPPDLFHMVMKRVLVAVTLKK